jgi:cell division septation protein DedD
MRSVFDQEEDEDIAEPATSREEGQDRELTISSTTLLAIFFGLVLVCGFFFALGYSLGRRSAPATAATDTTAAASTSRPIDSLAKPSAGEAGVTTTPATTDALPADGAADADGSATPQPETAAQPVVRPAITPAVSTPSPQPKPAITTKTTQPIQSTPTVKLALPETAPQPAAQQPAASAGAGIMVQIAAISNPADAKVLIDALKKHGFNAVPRHEPNDSLIHVQVGPFANRADAVAMRQKLLSDGYNAILK